MLPSWENMRNDWGMSNHLVRDFPQKYLQTSSSTPNMLFQPICSNGDWMESWTGKVNSLKSLGLCHAHTILLSWYIHDLIDVLNKFYLSLPNQAPHWFVLPHIYPDLPNWPCRHYQVAAWRSKEAAQSEMAKEVKLTLHITPLVCASQIGSFPQAIRRENKK